MDKRALVETCDLAQQSIEHLTDVIARLREYATRDQAADDLVKPNSDLQDLNFKVSPELHRAFKTTASLRKIAMKDLLEAAFRCWQDTYGDDLTRFLLPPHLDK